MTIISEPLLGHGCFFLLSFSIVICYLPFHTTNQEVTEDIVQMFVSVPTMNRWFNWKFQGAYVFMVTEHAPENIWLLGLVGKDGLSLLVANNERCSIGQILVQISKLYTTETGDDMRS